MVRGDPSWQHEATLRFLTTAPLLENFDLRADDVLDLELPLLTSLRKLKIYLKNIRFVEKVPRLVEKNRGLTALHLAGCGASASSEAWNILQSVDQHLTDICAECSPELLAYISSYSGVEKLQLHHPVGDPRAFFYDVLPHHAATLLELSCIANRESPWSFGLCAVDGLLNLQRLTHLTMGINEAHIAAPVNAVVRS
jgi:hypothetical protein